VLEDFRRSPLSDAEKCLLAFIEKVNQRSNQISQADVDELKRAGWSEEAIFDAITICSLFNFYNRWVDATGVQDMPKSAYELSGKRLAARGYLHE
jgi:alkylhydroperoxidase family enzyme